MGRLVGDFGLLVVVSRQMMSLSKLGSWKYALNKSSESIKCGIRKLLIGIFISMPLLEKVVD